jgi:O-antigen/teichoic acid export membrane protein
MLAEKTQKMPAMSEKHHITFFRQSGWMMMAGLVNGLLMLLVHPIVTRFFPTSEYGVFTTLLQVTAMMTIPAGGLQPVIAQQQAAAITDEKQRIVASEFRGVMQALFFIWLLMVAAAAIFWKHALTDLKIQNPIALAVTVIIGLASMWMPLTQGILQGRQNFLWLGWMNIFNACGRVGVICLVVLVFHGWAAGAMTGVLFGMAMVIAIGLWQVRDVWKVEKVRVQWKDWLSRVIPLTLGLGAANFMLSADMIFTQRFFPADQTGFYAVAGTIGRALIFLTQPLTIVMFPKLARAKATGEKSNALILALGTTLLFGACAAIVCTIVPWLPPLIMGGEKYRVAAPLVPWFAWCMLPLALSQVMANSLMARSKFLAVPWLIIIAVSYGFALSVVGSHCGNMTDTFAGFKAMIRTIGAFNLLMFGVCAFFTWVKFDKNK